jgi:hypothetical protein
MGIENLINGVTEEARDWTENWSRNRFYIKHLKVHWSSILSYKNAEKDKIDIFCLGNGRE